MTRRARVDAELVRRGLARSRQQAAELIGAGRVTINGMPAAKPATAVEMTAALAVEGSDERTWVSRGAHKLIGALDDFGIEVTGRRCLDAGASTGGFTEVLLDRGAVEVVAVDVGDHNSRALQRAWGAREKFSVLAYQLWLAVAWKIGCHMSPTWGTRMTRDMARWLGCPTPATSISHKMNYPYAMQWFGSAGGFKSAQQVQLPMPLLFVYGERKPFMFHSTRWLEQMAAKPGNAVRGLPCGHWVMISRAEAFHAIVRDWLRGQAPIQATR